MKIINNFATLNYQIDKLGQLIDKEKVSNIVTTVIPMEAIAVVKTSDKNYIKVGDIITYTVTITNIGEDEIYNVIMNDIIDINTEFIEGSVVVNGVLRPLENIINLNVGNLSPGGVTIVIFKVVVVTYADRIINNVAVDYSDTPASFIIKSTNDKQSHRIISNTVQIPFIKQESSLFMDSLENKYAEPVILESEYFNNIISFIQTADKNTLLKGEHTILTFKISNLSHEILTNIMVNVLLDIGLKFDNSLGVYINNKFYNNLNPIKGIKLSKLCPYEIIEISFYIFVEDDYEEILCSRGFIEYCYCSIINKRKSNKICLKIEREEEEKVDAIKSKDLRYEPPGWVIFYSIEIKNNNAHPIKNCVLHDVLEAGQIFKNGSIYIDDVNYPEINSPDNIPLGTLESGQVKKITFLVDA